MHSVNLIKSIIDTVPMRIFWKDKNLNYLGCNMAFAYDAGIDGPEEIIGKNDYELSWKDQAELYRNDDMLVIRSGVSKLGFEEQQTTHDGITVWVRTSKVPLYSDNGDLVGVLGMYDDITELKDKEHALLSNQQQLKTIIETEPECVKLVDPTGVLIDMNPAGLALLQANTLEEAQSQHLIDYIKPQWQDAFMNLHQKVMAGESGILEFEMTGLNGKDCWLETHAVPMHDVHGNVSMLLGITRDVTQRKKDEEHIQYLANYDLLTGLPNREKLEEQLSYIIALSKRNQWSFALMFLDIDHFKDINDTLGHNIGNKLLVEASHRFKSVIREEDSLARFGGDEFIFLIPNCNAEGAQHIAQKLIEAIQPTFSIENHELTISASIGISIYPIDGLDIDTLSKHSDIAMYKAKAEGRNRYSFFTEQMQLHANRNLQINSAMHQALAQNEFYLVYQPQISLESRNIIGCESLLRWHNLELGDLSPMEFIPIAESNGLISSIGEWVLRTALKQLSAWIDQGLPPIQMAVNLSAVQFRDEDLIDKITTILDEEKVGAKYLELELTESATMCNPQKAVEIMNSLHEKGIKISIDDFGTGYSSLSYLKKLKVSKLKIDRSFVQDITIDPEDKAIVSAIITMAKSLDITTIAEGVETQEQFDYLHEQGCLQVQGYFCSKPLLPERFFNLFQTKTANLKK